MGINFKFLTENFVNTTTQLAVDSNTQSAVNLFDRNTSTVYISSGYNANTATTITWTPPSPILIDRIYLQNCNFGQFEIYYNGTTTNAFTPAITCNSATADDMYFEFTGLTVTSVGIKVTNTYPVNTEKSIGELYIGEEYIELDRNPSTENYRPIRYRKGQDMEMSDGGMVSIFLKSKFRTSIALPYVSASQTAVLKAVWDTHRAIQFMPFPHNNVYYNETTTAWGGAAYEVNWLGDFDALQYSSNILGNGYNVNINLAETPN